MRATMLDVSARYGYPCRDFLPRMSSMVCFQDHMIKEMVENSDLIVFGGGADIATAIYGHRVMYPGGYLGLSERDRFEVAVFDEALRQAKPILGICRGSQLVCALSGGALVQDIDHHCATHPIQTWDEQVELAITSTHHQQMYLMNLIANEDYELLAWTECLSSKYIRDEALAPLAPDCDPEVVFFRNTQAFAIQGHPEYLQQKDPVVKWLQEQLFNYFPELK
jgi:gamma-glutamyl-gamma-aminobutyrate hydrolase PuuD